jgi:pimeloyl-ACP methyl ester carboxylesterase
MFGGRLKTDGAELAYIVKGSGEPVVLISGGVFADAFYPLLGVGVMTERYRLISYHRRGFGSSTHSGVSSVKQDVSDVLGLIRHLKIDRVHVVGHSYGGVIALQLTLDAPEKVKTLSMLEPPLINILPEDPKFAAGIQQFVEMYQAGKKAEAVDAFLRYAAGAGEGYRATIDAALPKGAWDLAVRDADILFNGDFPGVMSFRFTEEDARRIKQPVLLIRGTDSGPANLEIQQILEEWLSQAESVVLPGVTHLLQIQDPGRVADGLASFVSKHPS